MRYTPHHPIASFGIICRGACLCIGHATKDFVILPWSLLQSTLLRSVQIGQGLFSPVSLYSYAGLGQLGC